MGIKRTTFSIVDTIIIFVVSLLLFLVIMFYLDENTDLVAHARIAKEMNENGNLFSGNFLLYFLISLFSLFSTDLQVIKISLCVLLALAVTFKYNIIKCYFASFLIFKKAGFLSFSLSVIYILPLFYFLKSFGIFLNTENMYLGYYVPNVWHNSTVIFLFPFAILLYLLSFKQLNEYDKKRNYFIAILVILNVLIKPSFFFVFLIAYPLTVIFKVGFKDSPKYFLLPITAGLLSLLYVYLTIYSGDDGSAVTISFNNILNATFWINNGKYLFVSLFFPILYFVFNYKALIKDWEFLYVILLFIVSVGVFYLCREVGPRANHGNFYWQIVITTWLVFLYMAKQLFVVNVNQTNLRLNSMFKVLYSLHVVMGVVYIIKLLMTKDFG